MPASAPCTLQAATAGCSNQERRQLLRRQSAAGTPLRLQQPRRQQRWRAAAASVPVLAAQKKVFTSFQDMIQQSSEPSLVEFYATWCGPCKMMSDILAEVAPAMRDKVKFIKVDTGKYPSVANTYEIRALPTLILFKNGAAIDRVEGVLGPADLKNRLDYMLSQHS